MREGEMSVSVGKHQEESLGCDEGSTAEEAEAEIPWGGQRLAVE
jgi:hypothetical protein